MTSININKFLSGKFNWEESYPSIILGAIIVIILGLLVANFFSKRNQAQPQIDQSAQTSQQQNQPASANSKQEYKVVAGDSLSSISEKYYGSQNYAMILASENKIANPNMLWTDITLSIPTKSDVVAMKESQPAMMQVTSYKVVQGDTYFTIAQKLYGDGSKWTVLDKANGSLRLPNGNPLVFADSTIVVPR